MVWKVIGSLSDRPFLATALTVAVTFTSSGYVVTTVGSLLSGVSKMPSPFRSHVYWTLNSTIADETTTPVKTVFTGGSTLYATAVATDIIAEIQNNATGHGPALSRADVARYVGIENRALYSGGPKSDLTKEAVARALAEVGQTRTWGLLIDVVAQTGHYATTAASASTPLAAFVVDGEKRYWLHVTIDRFDPTIVGQQLEEVFEQ